MRNGSCRTRATASRRSTASPPQRRSSSRGGTTAARSRTRFRSSGGGSTPQKGCSRPRCRRSVFRMHPRALGCRDPGGFGVWGMPLPSLSPPRPRHACRAPLRSLRRMPAPRPTRCRRRSNWRRCHPLRGGTATFLRGVSWREPWRRRGVAKPRQAAAVAETEANEEKARVCEAPAEGSAAGAPAAASENELQPRQRRRRRLREASQPQPQRHSTLRWVGEQELEQHHREQRQQQQE